MLGVPVTHWFWLIFAAEVFRNYFFLEARPEIPCTVNKVKVSLQLQPLLLLFWKLLKGYILLIISNLTKTWRLVLAGRFQTRVQHSPETSWQKHLTSLLEYLCCCSLLRNNTLCFGDGGGAELYPATGLIRVCSAAVKLSLTWICCTANGWSKHLDFFGRQPFTKRLTLEKAAANLHLLKPCKSFLPPAPTATRCPATRSSSCG